jgi:hypothetical protein
MSENKGVLYVNDRPQRVDGHAHYYDPAATHVVAVTYVTANGRATRVSFDPHTGNPWIQVYDEERKTEAEAI